MRFSTLAISLLSGLSVFKGVVASPIESAALAKRQTVDEVVNDLKSAVSNPVLILKNPDVSAADAQSALQAISSAISAANAAVPGSVLAAKRSLTANTNVERSELSNRQADDLEIVGRVLAEIITDLVEAISGLADNLKGLPLIGALIIAIDGGLNTLLLGVEVVLVGVIQIVQGLLVGLSGLLASLGGGLLAGLLFGL